MRSHSRWLPHSLPVLAAALGCVSVGTHQEVVEERDDLKRRVERLEQSTQSLDAERAELIDEMEDLRIAREQLDADVRKLREVEDTLSTDLAAREAELAKHRREISELRSTYEGLVSDLEAEVAAGDIEIQQLRDGLQLNLSQDVLFPSGSAEVNAAGRDVLGRVAERLREVAHRVVVRGHTDDVPIRSARYPTNWELAGARASGVVRLLAERGVGEDRLSAVSLGEHAPRASNATPEGRARNRRIEIALMPARQQPPTDADAGAAGAASGGP